MVMQNTNSISYLNNSVVMHTHQTAVGPTTPSIMLLGSHVMIANAGINNRVEKAGFSKDLELMKINYLNPDFGSDFINSKNVFTT